MIKSLISSKKEHVETDRGFVLDMYGLIKVNNELINRLMIEIHYLNNEVLEQGRILRDLLGDRYKPGKALHEI